ncbi:MAG: sugar phosphate isomerase/epimerase [Planctomycetota bacterium]|nr:sugar phosphate isomerase/epimerase [Planctomycetota bacterium]
MKESNRQGSTRREFLSRAACVAAGAAGVGMLGSRAAWGENAPWKMHLSASSIDFTRLPIEQACERIAALGFEAIDIWSPHAKCPHLDDVQKRLGAQGLKDLLARTKLKLYAFSVYAGGYPKYAELLGQAGGGVAVRGSGGQCDPAQLTAKTKAFIEGLKRELELAEKYNSYIAIENHGGSMLNSLDSFKAFVDNNTNPRLGLALAPYHLQAAKASVEDAIAVAGKQLLFFYAWQNGGGLAQLPGHGPTDFSPWLAALAKIDYKWYVNPFMHDEPVPDEMSKALEKSREYLKGCYEKAVGPK